MRNTFIIFFVLLFISSFAIADIDFSSNVSSGDIDFKYVVTDIPEFEFEYVPYTGATGNVDLGANDLYVNNIFFMGGNITFNGTDNIWDFR